MEELTEYQTENMSVPIADEAEWLAVDSAADAESATEELSRYVLDIFRAFKIARLPFEEIWQECWFNYLAQYQPNLNWKKQTEGMGWRSRVFIRLTALKCHTAHSKIIDLFAGKGGVPFDACAAMSAEAIGLNIDQVQELVRRSKERLTNHFRLIEFEEALSNFVLEACILGTGVIKGPIVETRKRVRVMPGMGQQKYRLNTEYITLPVVDHIPLWEYYIDTNARSTTDSIGEIHFQRLLPAQFSRFSYQGGYDSAKVKEAAQRATLRDEHEDYKYIQLGDNYTGENGVKDERISVLEYQGIVPADLLIRMGKEVPEGTHPDDGVEAIVVLAADGIVIKACCNPLGARQFKVCPYKKRPHSIFGVGVAESMLDSQRMVNSAARLIIDNKALSGNGMIAINKDRIDTKRTKSLDVYPFKTWYVKGNVAPREAIDSLTFPDVTAGLMELMGMFERLADEETGIPKYTHGEQGSFLNKMLDINTPVPMADGSYKTMGTVVDGDRIIGSKGSPTKVIQAHPVQYPKRAYEILFASGDIIKAGGEHLWTIERRTKAGYASVIINTDALYKKFLTQKSKLYIPRIQRPQFGVPTDLPLNPYMLGLWLGNGHAYGARLTIRDEDRAVVEYVRRWARKVGAHVTVDAHQNGGKSTTYSIGGDGASRSSDGRYEGNNSLHSLLNSLGLLKQKGGNKFIPDVYFKAPYKDRLALLRGLMDSDGCHHSGALVIFTQKEGRLLNDTVRLIEGLGGFARLSRTFPGPLAKKNVNYYNVTFTLVDNPFALSERAKKWQAPKTKVHRQRIVSIKPVEICEMRCLTVDAEDGLYAVGNRFTLTHNTATGISMLMTSANINLKEVIKNIDDYIIEPIVEQMHDWFMAFQPDPNVDVPLGIKALGADSLMAREIKLEKYLQFAKVFSAPQDAILQDRVKLQKVVADLLETADIMRSQEEIDQIVEQMAQTSSAPKNMREIVAIDRLFQFLAPSEQAQILQELGITPDAVRMQGLEQEPFQQDAEQPQQIEQQEAQIESEGA